MATKEQPQPTKRRATRNADATKCLSGISTIRIRRPEQGQGKDANFGIRFGNGFGDYFNHVAD